MWKVARVAHLFLISGLVVAGASCGEEVAPGGGEPTGQIEAALHCTTFPSEGGTHSMGTLVTSANASYAQCGTDHWFAADFINESAKTITAEAEWGDTSPSNSTDCGNSTINLSVTGINITWVSDHWVITGHTDLGTDSSTGFWTIFGCSFVIPSVTESPSTAWDAYDYIRIEGQAKTGSTYKKVKVLGVAN